MSEKSQDDCPATRVVSAKAAEECCQDALESLAEALDPTRNSFAGRVVNAILEHQAKLDEPSPATLKVVTELFEALEKAGYKPPPDAVTRVVHEEGPDIVGFVQTRFTPEFQTQGPTRFIQEPGKVSPPGTGMRQLVQGNAVSARAGGAAAGFAIASALLTLAARSTRRNARGKRQSSCCGCVLSKVFSDDNPQRKTSIGPKRRRVAAPER